MPFLHAVNAVRCILLILTLVWTNQCNAENAWGNGMCKRAYNREKRFEPKLWPKHNFMIVY
jgi:hypothetical protein